MALSFCAKCGAKLGVESKGIYCAVCMEAEKYGLYRAAFKAKRMVYLSPVIK
ncbi:MAG: hypothetical protein KAJ24_02465 [Candidatus Aenigmarchaeota archaeon]|nr:hypothetical protein [Candidatus Aenigmarchaeota archaeon]